MFLSECNNDSQLEFLRRMLSDLTAIGSSSQKMCSSLELVQDRSLNHLRSKAEPCNQQDQWYAAHSQIAADSYFE